MSNFDNEKDYDLDYFNSRKEKEEPQNSDLMPGENVSDDEQFDLNAFSGQSDVNEEQFVVDPKQDNSEEIDFSSYGKKQETIKKEKKKDKSDEIKNRVKKIAKISLKVLVSVMLIGFITGCLVVGAFAVYVFNYVDDSIDDNLDELTLGFTTTIYVKDSESGEYVEYQRLHGEENRIWVGYDNIPEQLRQAYIAVEDQRFLEHQGVDWKRTVGAFANMFLNFYSSNQGGSTITQQLVKNLTGDNKQTPMRKIREIMRARRLEEQYEKETILECYLNTICLGGGIYGVEVAANYYFGKSVSELTLAECASLASLAKEPEKYRPDKNPQYNETRRNLVLRLMYQQGYITEAEYKDSSSQKLEIVADDSAKGNGLINDYFVDTVIEEVIDRLVAEQGMDEAYASKRVYNGGYKIYCTLDTRIQDIMEDEYSKKDTYFTLTSEQSGKSVQSAMTIMDYKGHILGIVGGSGEKTSNRGYNRATMAFRQPGSTMKPLASYSQALQKNLIHFSSMLEDSPLANYYPGGGSGPRNSYGYYRGYITAAEALERSTNTIPCRLVKKLGTHTTYYYLLDNFGIDSLNYTQDSNLSSLGLGGTYTGISTTQSAAAFAVFGNLGTYYEPTTITLMTDQHGKVIFKEKDGKPAIDENTASIINHMLQNVVYGQGGTARAIASFSNTIKCFAKTGTSSDVYDSWLAGGTPYYVGSCWFGYDEQEKLNNANLAKTMWKNVMKRVHDGLEPKEFLESDFVTHRYYCMSTGLLATDACTNIKEGWYKTTYSLPGVCTAHPGAVRPVIGTEPEVPEQGEGGEQGDSDTTSSTVSSSMESTTSSNVSSSTESTTSLPGSSSTNSDSSISGEPSTTQ